MIMFELMNTDENKILNLNMRWRRTIAVLSILLFGSLLESIYKVYRMAANVEVELLCAGSFV